MPLPKPVTQLPSPSPHPVTHCSGVQPSGLQCDNGDVLVRRFFLYDVVTGLTAGSGQVPLSSLN